MFRLFRAVWLSVVFLFPAGCAVFEQYDYPKTMRDDLDARFERCKNRMSKPSTREKTFLEFLTEEEDQPFFAPGNSSREVDYFLYCLDDAREIECFLAMRMIGANSRTSRGIPRLAEAAKMDDYLLASVLVKRGAKIDPIPDWGFGEIHAAVLNNDLTKAAGLLRTGSDVRTYCYAVDTDGRTPLFFAHSLPMVKLLASYGADLNASDYLGTTPLMHAAHFHNWELVTWLVEHGATLDVNPVSNWSPLTFAIRADDPDLIQYLLKNGAKVNPGKAETQPRIPYLAEAAAYASPSAFERIEKAGGKLDCVYRNHRGETGNLLHAAAENDNFVMVRYLVEKRSFDRNARNSAGLTPWDLTADPDIKKFLRP